MIMNLEMSFEINIICIICIIISSINIYMYRYNCIIQNENNLNLLKIIYWDEQIQNEQKKYKDIYDEQIQNEQKKYKDIYDEQIQNEQKYKDIYDENIKIINNTLNYIIDSNNEMMSNTQILLNKP